jgi:hypothetical protein
LTVKEKEYNQSKQNQMYKPHQFFHFSKKPIKASTTVKTNGNVKKNNQ